MTTTIKLTDVPRRIRKDFGKIVPYRKLHGRILDGAVPAERDASGRWEILLTDLPAIAEDLGVDVMAVGTPTAA